MHGETPSGTVPDGTPTSRGAGHPPPDKDPLTLAEVLSYLAWGVALSADHLRALRRVEEHRQAAASARAEEAKLRECERSFKSMRALLELGATAAAVTAPLAEPSAERSEQQLDAGVSASDIWLASMRVEAAVGDLDLAEVLGVDYASRQLPPVDAVPSLRRSARRLAEFRRRLDLQWAEYDASERKCIAQLEDAEAAAAHLLAATRGEPLRNGVARGLATLTAAAGAFRVRVFGKPRRSATAWRPIPAHWFWDGAPIVADAEVGSLSRPRPGLILRTAAGGWRVYVWHEVRVPRADLAALAPSSRAGASDPTAPSSDPVQVAAPTADPAPTAEAAPPALPSPPASGKRHRPPPVSYRGSDEALARRMRGLIERGEARNTWDAALKVSDDAKGYGRPESRAKRLHGVYSAMFSSERDGKD